MRSEVFSSLEEFNHLNDHARKWAALGDVLRQATPFDPGHMRSCGDSITYRTGDPGTWVRDHFIAHRLYQTVFMPVTGHNTLMIAPRSELRTTRPYCDLDDCEHLVGGGELVEVTEGTILVNHFDDAWRVIGGDGILLQARITVEGPGLVTPFPRLSTEPILLQAPTSTCPERWLQ